MTSMNNNLEKCIDAQEDQADASLFNAIGRHFNTCLLHVYHYAPTKSTLALLLSEHQYNGTSEANYGGSYA